MTYGEKAVGLTFNPSNDPAVYEVKKTFAAIVELLNLERANSASGEAKRLYSIAITEAQGAQMWAVKALTWKD